MRLQLFIPLLPPGINRTYKAGVNKQTGKLLIYKDKAVKDYQAHIGLMIGAKAGEIDFNVKDYDKLFLTLKIYNSKMDVDAPIKMIQDAIADKLEFDDKQIQQVSSIVIQDDKKEKGVMIELEVLNEKN